MVTGALASLKPDGTILDIENAGRRRDGAPELIMVVEDSPTQALRTRLLLEQAGWRVEVCRDGPSALARASEMTPDLILLDIHLPCMGGREVALRLKSDPILVSIPIVFLTSAFAELEDIIQGLDQGADDYLLKSVRAEEMIARVRARLRSNRTQRELGRLARLLLSVNQVGSQLAGIHDLPRLLDYACQLLHGELPETNVSVYLVTEGELVLSAAAGPNALELLADPPRLPLDGDSLAAACIRAGRMLQMSLPAVDSRSHLRLAGVRSTAALPLPTAGDAAGALEIASGPALTLDDTDKLIVSTIADLLGIGVQNQQLFRRLHSLAMTDGLTGLLNRRAIVSHLEGEWSRCQRHARPLALISMDIDSFKQINDGYGHATGDLAIKAVGEMVCRVIRREDFAGRLGGDEFLVVLPDTNRSGALDLAERIRSAVERGSIEDPESGSPVTLTISLGVASWPETEAPTADDLLRSSDLALYRAKAAGRNQASA